MTTTSEEPPRAPVAGSEAATLRGFLAFHRAVVRRKAEGLDVVDLNRAVAPSTMTLGGIVKHLAFVEDYWVSYVLAGGPPSEPWASAPWDDDEDWDWHSAAADEPTDLLALHARIVAAVDAVLDDACAGPDGLDALAAREARWGRVSLRWVLAHLVQEYARHAGHADLLREAVDGTTGD